jgi:hypothetical protein
MREPADAVELDAPVDERDERQRGFVMVWMVVVLFVLLGVAAFAVDIVHAYVVGQQTQNAADAAALAGAAQIPADIDCGVPGSHAQFQANQLVTANLSKAGFSHSDYNVSFNCANDQVTVNLKTHFDTWFARAIGFDTLTVSRTGTAEYDAPLEMGSPENHLGDVPSGSCVDLGYSAVGTPCATNGTPADQHLWAQIQGPGTYKSSGNAFTTNYCAPLPSGPTKGETPDGCPTGVIGAPNAENLGNANPNENGEFFMIDDQTPGPLTVAIYDAGFVNTGGGFGSWCDPSTNAITLTGVAATRYGLNSPFCAGDISQGGDMNQGPMDTHVSLRAPDPDTNPYNNPAASCSSGGQSSATGDELEGPGGIPGDEPQNVTKDALSPVAAKYFEQWVEVCTVTGAGPTLPNHPYELHVWSDTGRGTNAFSILATHGLGGSPVGINIYSRESLPLYAVKSLADPTPATFFVARVPQSGTERTLDLQLFDFGDSPGGAATPTISLFGSNDVKGLDSGLGCRYTERTANDETPDTPYGHTPPTPLNPSGSPPPWSSWVPIAPGTGCSIGVTVLTWENRWVDLEVDLPQSYTCTNTLDGCWIKMTINAGSSQIQDATTWNAKVSGTPVRLVG